MRLVVIGCCVLSLLVYLLGLCVVLVSIFGQYANVFRGLGCYVLGYFSYVYTVWCRLLGALRVVMGLCVLYVHGALGRFVDFVRHVSYVSRAISFSGFLVGATSFCCGKCPYYRVYARLMQLVRQVVSIGVFIVAPGGPGTAFKGLVR